jgi:hypothetical protein
VYLQAALLGEGKPITAAALVRHPIVSVIRRCDRGHFARSTQPLNDGRMIVTMRAAERDTAGMRRARGTPAKAMAYREFLEAISDRVQEQHVENVT